MKKRDGDSRNAEGGSGGGGPEYNKKKHKKRLGGKGLSLEAFVGANRIKPIVTASQIRKFIALIHNFLLFCANSPDSYERII